MTAAEQHDHRDLLQRALVALDEMEAKLEATEHKHHEAIAVVGMGLRFPGDAHDPESFWELLMSGRDAVTEIPRDRWDLDAMFDPDPETIGKSYTRWGAFIDGIDQFDAGFFGISPREAVSMDPQQRLLLEVAWEALEHAGIAPPDLAGSATGVFIGIIGTEYADLALQNGIMADADAYFASGVAQSVAAGRLAYVFDFHGPAVALDTACSSSLLATHLACQALRTGDCDAALAGGVSLMLSPDAHILTSQARMMSFEGRCKTFDASADGYVRGEGCAFLVLKRLSDAVADGNRILGMIRGTSVNQDGRSNGLTAPNAAAQESVIRRALADAGVDPSAVGFVECHGTGTTLGDPIEIRALQAVFGKDRPADRPLRVQSVKTNIGHLEGTAGIAGLCKLLLAVEKGELPTHLHLTDPNPYIPWRDIAVVAETGPSPWHEPDGRPRVGGVSSFGFSGTNVHIVVEQPPEPSIPEHEVRERPHRVYTVSGQSSDVLDRLASAHATALTGTDADAWGQAAFTANTGRAHLDERVAVVASTGDEAAGRLRAAVEGAVSADVVRGRSTVVDDGVVMLFTGQGSQVPGMGRRLYETEPTFRSVIDESAGILHGLSGFDLREVMFDAGDRSGRLSIHDTRCTQPALFSYEVAMAALWRSWGVEPAAVIGHSIGELAAAHVAGVMSLRDALKVVDARGQLMQMLPREGGMATVFAEPDVVRRAIAPWADALSIAALNGPRSLVVSGRHGPLDAVIAEFETAGFRVVRLDVSHAFHSPLMEPMLDDFERVVASIDLADPEIEIITNRTGKMAEPGLLTSPAYWRDHVREAVRFEESVHHAIDVGHRSFLEVGPAPTLSAMARSCELPTDVAFFASSRRSDDEALELHRAVAALHVAGVGLDWKAYEAPWERRPGNLPIYPFERQRFWHPRVQPDNRSTGAAPAPGDDPSLIGHRLRSPRLDGHVFQRELSPRSPEWLADHVVYGATIVPATVYLELMRRAGREAHDVAYDVVDVRIDEPLLLDGEAATVVQTLVDDRIDTAEVEILSADGDSWRHHARGRLTTPSGPAVPCADADSRAEIDRAWARCEQAVDGADYYEALQRLGVDYGPQFRCIERGARSDGEVVATLRAPRPEVDSDGFHPALADGCLQALGLAMPGAGDLSAAQGDAYMPVGIDRWRVAGRADGLLTALGRVRPAGDGLSDVMVGDLDLFDERGGLVASLAGVRFKRAPRAALPSAAEQSWLYTPRWTASSWNPGSSKARLSGHWVILAGSDLGPALTERIRADGATAELVGVGEDTSVQDIGAELDEPLAERPDGVVIVLPLAARSADFQAACVADVISRMARLESAPPLTVITQRAMAVVPGDRAEGHERASAWGVGRVAGTEHPDLFCRLVDLAGGDAVEQIHTELLVDDREEPQVAWRDGVRYALRLARSADVEALDVPVGPYELEISERGRLDALRLVEQEDLEAGPGEVLIDVRATGLNFRDVLNAMGTYAGDASSLGGECAGTVVAVGEGVERVRPGDHVMAVAVASFATRCVVPERMVTRQPSGWSHAEAATVPIAFLTADYALNHLGRMRAGDRVLIHAAAGGVGMAALQLAQRAGAEIFATAGSEIKRDTLRAIGVRHVYDSRRLDFRDEILRDTAGAGVDLVLNSLSGESISASVDVLAPSGRFLEIGMAGIWDQEQLEAVRPDVEYHVVYLGQVCVDQPELIAGMLDELAADCERGVLHPMPVTAFDIRQSVAAFRFMAQARQIGKVVVTAAVGWNIPEAHGTWIITGGLGGLGLTVAAELADAGASRLVLCSRRPPSDDAATHLAGLGDRGPDVRVMELDVCDRDAVARMVKEVTADGMPLRGVVHAAGVLDDGMLRDLTYERFESVMRPKVLGAQNLAAAVDPHRPDHFILFSAGAVLFGAPGQANYAAANAVLDAMAHSRRAAGLPAQTINWGPWTGVGMAARLGSDVFRRWESQGVIGLAPNEGRSALRAAVSSGDRQLAILKLRWPALVHYFSKHRVPPILHDLVRSEQRRRVTSDDETPSNDLADELSALSIERRADRLREQVRDQVLRVLGLEPTYPIDQRQGFTDVGMDSLMAIELSNRLSVLVNRTLASTLAFEQPTLEELTLHLQDVLADRVDFAPVAGPRQAEDESLNGLTDHELTEALFKELDGAGY